MSRDAPTLKFAGGLITFAGGAFGWPTGFRIAQSGNGVVARTGGGECVGLLAAADHKIAAGLGNRIRVLVQKAVLFVDGQRTAAMVGVGLAANAGTQCLITGFLMDADRSKDEGRT